MDRLLLYSGLTFLIVAFLIRGAGMAMSVWVPLFGVAILLKASFLYVTVRQRKWEWNLWLVLILSGVVLIFVSLIFKYILPLPLLRTLLFYGAITLKITGLLLIIAEKTLPSLRKKKRKKSHNLSAKD